MNYKNNISILSVIIILLCGCQPDKKTTFTAASYNLRNANIRKGYSRSFIISTFQILFDTLLRQTVGEIDAPS